jgi:hypothetical protein
MAPSSPTRLGRRTPLARHDSAGTNGSLSVPIHNTRLGLRSPVFVTAVDSAKSRVKGTRSKRAQVARPSVIHVFAGSFFSPLARRPSPRPSRFPLRQTTYPVSLPPSLTPFRSSAIESARDRNRASAAPPGPAGALAPSTASSSCPRPPSPPTHLPAANGA